MYADKRLAKFFHGPLGVPPGIRSVIVLEGGETADAVMWRAYKEKAVYTSWGGDKLFWVVFPNKPDRAWDFTAGALRRELRKANQPKG